MKNKFLNRKTLTVVLCIMMVMVTLGFASSTKTLFPDEIAKELGVSRSAVVIGESVRYATTAIVNIFFGLLIAKFGEKKLISAGFLSLITAVLLYSFATNLAMIYLGGMFLGIGFSWTTTAMVGRVVDLWYSENKGTIMGLVLASNGVGGAIAIQLVGSLIDPTVTGSYRKAYLLIAAVLAAAAVIMLIFFRNKPRDAETADTIKKKKKASSDWEGIPFSEAIHRFYFWGILVCIFFAGLILQGTYGIVAMHYKDVGIDYGKIKAMLSFSSLFLACSKFLAGFSYDRMGLRFTASFCILASVASSFLLAFTTGNEIGELLAIIYTVISPFAMPLETVMLPIYASELFGKHSYSTILGIFVSVNTAGFCVGGWVMNFCYDMMGSYYYALIAVGTIMLALLVLLQIVLTMAKKEKQQRRSV
jgi:MFS family permease